MSFPKRKAGTLSDFRSEIKKFIVSYVEKVNIYNDHVEVIFKLDAAGVAIDYTQHDDFSASVDKSKLFRLSSDAVKRKKEPSTVLQWQSSFSFLWWRRGESTPVRK